MHVYICMCIQIYFYIEASVRCDLNWKHVTTISYRLRALFKTVNVICIHSYLKITPSIFLALIRSDLRNTGKEFKLPSNPCLFFFPISQRLDTSVKAALCVLPTFLFSSPRLQKSYVPVQRPDCNSWLFSSSNSSQEQKRLWLMKGEDGKIPAGHWTFPSNSAMVNCEC